MTSFIESPLLGVVIYLNLLRTLDVNRRYESKTEDMSKSSTRFPKD